MSGGPLLPSSIYFGAASGNAFPAYFTPGTNTNSAGFIEGIGVVGSLGSDATAVIQFNMPESIPSGTLKVRILSWSTTGGSLVGKITIADAGTAVGANIGAATLTTDASAQSITFVTADLIVENKFALTGSGANTANNITTIKATFNTSGWTETATSVHQFSLVWE
jgi:hypothetical protein